MPDNLHTPVMRNPLFYDEQSFKYETDLVENYLEMDVNQTVILYRVDREKTQINDIYKENNDKIRFMNPVELPCLYQVDRSQIKSYDAKKANGVYVLPGNLTVYMMVKTLEKYDCDISRGDYLGVYIDDGRMIYFAVTDDGKVNTANENIIGAYRPGWRLITAAPQTEFNGE